MARRGTRFGRKGVESTFGGLDFGQDVKYLTWFGNSKLTDVSNGTKVISITGMGTLTHFFPSVRNEGASTGVIAVVQGYTTNAGVTMALFNESGASLAAKHSGATLHYFAVGTQA